SSRVPRKFTRIIKAIKQCRDRREAVFLYLRFVPVAAKWRQIGDLNFSPRLFLIIFHYLFK
ncbi:hypothetical protein DVH07_04045, partial [Hafnia paralvei]